MQNKPTYHFAPAKNWMNDPNGTIYRDGQYHLFYQYNPNGSSWGDICWAYATSEDLVNWTRKGIKLSPETDKGERYCFSGCAVADGEGYTLAYTSIGQEEWAIQQHARQRFCRANADFSKIERLYDFDMTAATHPFEVREWRDPFIFYYNNMPYMVLSGIRWQDGKMENSVLLYKSPSGSLTDFKFVDVILSDPDNIIECPNMAVFEGGKVALIYSTITDRKVKYISGDFDGNKLYERNRGVIDWSLKSFYATNISGSKSGKTVLYGWLSENLTQGDSPDGNYSGCLALPRYISLDASYKLHYEVIEAVGLLQDKPLEYKDGSIKHDESRAKISFELIGEGRFNLLENEREKMAVKVLGNEVIVSRYSEFSLAESSEQRMSVGGGQKRTFEIYFDGSVVEIFVDGVSALSVRFYREYKPTNLFVLKEGQLSNMQAYSMLKADIKD